MYQLPDKKIIDLVEASHSPRASMSPSAEWMILLSPCVFPAIEELAQQEYRLGGIRINPQTNGPSRTNYYETLSLYHLKDQTSLTISGITKACRISNIAWSPDSSKFLFSATEKDTISLWLVELDKLAARKLDGIQLNDVMPGLPYQWLSDAQSILFKSIDEERGALPAKAFYPSEPIIQESEDKIAPVRTFQDLLKNAYDEVLFEYYATAQLKILKLSTNTIRNFGAKGIIRSFDAAPGAAYIYIQYIKKPFSYIVPYTRFPFELLLYDIHGLEISKIAEVPLAEHIPNKFGAVRTGPRSFNWRADVPASLYWVEAQDEGDPKKELAIRDKLFCLTSPFTGKAREVLSFKLRYGGIDWGNDELAISYEWTWDNRRIITNKWSPKEPKQVQEKISDRSWENEYDNPGVFALKRNHYGRSVLCIDSKNKLLFLFGTGASPEGNRPFVDQLHIDTKESQRLWRSQAPCYEKIVAVINIEEKIFLSQKEATDLPPNYFLKDLGQGKTHQITQFENPYTALLKIKKELVQYKRADGVELSGTLYLPENYDPKKDGRLPVLMWAYPKEFKSRDAAGQLKASPYEFMRFSWSTPLFWVTQGYAIFDNFSMPVIGEKEEEPNEAFIEQLVAGAKAAIQILDDMGIADRNRVAVGGHSYGAFMTANLLAHSQLFAAGIARSGAYNRTLTPFGFQSEERSLWDAPETYFKMSPFMYADKIKTPLLLIHGEADNNSGTFPMQSERFFAALKGHGAKVRLVMLPHESHSYKARESIMHMLWEISRWLEIHVKNKQTKTVEMTRTFDQKHKKK